MLYQLSYIPTQRRVAFRFVVYVQVTVRDVVCDTWIGHYFDQDANRDTIVQWYFTTVGYEPPFDLVLKLTSAPISSGAVRRRGQSRSPTYALSDLEDPQ